MNPSYILYKLLSNQNLSNRKTSISKRNFDKVKYSSFTDRLGDPQLQNTIVSKIPSYLLRGLIKR